MTTVRASANLRTPRAHPAEWWFSAAATEVQGMLTDEHPLSNYGLPVYVEGGIAYGSSDLLGPDVYVGASAQAPSAFLGRARDAGYAVHVIT